ncbi:hypothetical protein GCM10022226_82810 [Sphaerisporangium flaviroseum]|uniref:Uncharacterized protein n=1 Tax=Sphaerisporangium flaviroseum TaxID=509199 RepID=A0ABP7JKF4_9ACTN
MGAASPARNAAAPVMTVVATDPRAPTSQTPTSISFSFHEPAADWPASCDNRGVRTIADARNTTYGMFRAERITW